MVKSLLKNAEIEAFLKNIVISSYMYEPIQSEQVKVLISNYDYDKAKRIVDDYYLKLNNNGKK